MNNMSLSTFAEQLLLHDWHYGYSDCSRTYRQGHDNHVRLQRIAGQSKDHHDLWWRAFIKFGR